MIFFRKSALNALKYYSYLEEGNVVCWELKCWIRTGRNVFSYEHDCSYSSYCTKLQLFFLLFQLMYPTMFLPVNKKVDTVIIVLLFFFSSAPSSKSNNVSILSFSMILLSYFSNMSFLYFRYAVLWQIVEWVELSSSEYTLI